MNPFSQGWSMNSMPVWVAGIPGREGDVQPVRPKK